MEIENLKQNDRINDLETKVDALIDLIYPVGSYYETSEVLFNPNTSWGGTWEKMTGGEVLIDSGYLKESADGSSAIDVSVDSVVGNKWHTLTIEEMPSHRHDIRATNGWGSLDFGFDFTYTNTASYNGSGSDYVGEDLRFELTPKARIVVRWHRVA